ncbi:MAG: RluA family pseudouridine synthase [Anaerolineales bacterium]|nr:RluA family pseudouridine synthase [Anaerolineales bacterium]
MSERQETFIYHSDKPERLDKFLVSCLPDFSRSRLQGLIKNGRVLVNDQIAHKGGQTLETGMRVRVSIPAPVPSDLIPEAIPLDIIFERPDLLVVNKPAGMVVHPSAGHHSGTLVHAALAHAPEMEGISGELRPGVVHRLDKDTSGLILLAKNDRAHQYLQAQFKARNTRKIYLALVDGQPPTPQGRIDAAIGRDPRNRKRMAVTVAEKGRPAISEYRTLESFDAHTLLEVRPLTGRTHQIRVHMAFLGCPIVADRVYGRRKPSIALARHFLHAFRLTITLPGEAQAHTFEAPLPQELETILQTLRAVD